MLDAGFLVVYKIHKILVSLSLQTSAVILSLVLYSLPSF